MPILKKTKCRMKWCYSPLRHEDDTCDKFCTYNTIRVQTNADHIRSMTDEELAKYLDGVCHDLWQMFVVDPEKMWLDWLKKEVDT